MLLRIAVLADTHDFLPERLIGEISYADWVWHLGDVCQPRTLAPLQEKFGSRLLVIRGNND
ncbi:MAG: metallophosphatase family protein, partial [Chthoniobacterales bacterium]|nr:metallophosphatase family protein [Chthoniobacterales bacterium]